GCDLRCHLTSLSQFSFSGEKSPETSVDNIEYSMKLINVQIQNFRCIDDTTPFSINQTTCLVGKNESGKTAILQAIERLMSYDGGRRQYNKLQDYPRRYYSDYASRHP